MDAIILLGDVLAHRAYFSSFAREGGRDHPLARRFFGSAAALRNRMYELACANPPGFVSLSCHRGELVTDYAPRGAELYLSADPILVIDTWEHAYFYDYGFDRERYFARALSHLNFDKLDEIENIG